MLRIGDGWPPSADFRARVMRGKIRRPSGAWAMPRRAITCAGRPVISSPSKMTRPDRARGWPKMVIISVDLPAPFEPMRVTISPRLTSTSTLRAPGSCRRTHRRARHSTARSWTALGRRRRRRHRIDGRDDHLRRRHLALDRLRQQGLDHRLPPPRRPRDRHGSPSDRCGWRAAARRRSSRHSRARRCGRKFPSPRSCRARSAGCRCRCRCGSPAATG